MLSALCTASELELLDSSLAPATDTVTTTGLLSSGCAYEPVLPRVSRRVRRGPGWGVGSAQVAMGPRVTARVMGGIEPPCLDSPGLAARDSGDLVIESLCSVSFRVAYFDVLVQASTSALRLTSDDWGTSGRCPPARVSAFWCCAQSCLDSRSFPLPPQQFPRIAHTEHGILGRPTAGDAHTVILLAMVVSHPSR